MAVPCSQKESAFDSHSDYFYVHEECHDNKEEVLKWLGPYDLITYVNHGTFMLNEYGEKRIEYSSKILQTPTDYTFPNWTPTTMITN